MTNMKEFKGTKGKWYVKVSGYKDYIAVSSVDEDGYNQPIMYNSLSGDIKKELFEEQKANALLIAAAPELLEALRELTFLHNCEQEGLLSGMPTKEQWMEAVEIAEKAINKAL